MDDLRMCRSIRALHVMAGSACRGIPSITHAAPSPAVLTPRSDRRFYRFVYMRGVTRLYAYLTGFHCR
jgi:hypothetical protein